MQVATISSKRQITLPKDLLLSFGIKPGAQVLLHTQKEGVLVQPLKKSIVEEVAGSLSSYIPSSKRNVPFPRIMEETRKKTAMKLVGSL